MNTIARVTAILSVTALVLGLNSCILFFSTPTSDVYEGTIPEEYLYGAWESSDGDGFVAYISESVYQAVRFDWLTGETTGAVFASSDLSHSYDREYQVSFSGHYLWDDESETWTYAGSSDGVGLSANQYYGEPLAALGMRPEYYAETALTGLFLEEDYLWERVERVRSTVPRLLMVVRVSLGETTILTPQYVQGGDDVVSIDWTIVTAPVGSASEVVNVASTYSFTPDVAGRYELQFIGDTGTHFTPPGYVSIDAE